MADWRGTMGETVATRDAGDDEVTQIRSPRFGRYVLISRIGVGGIGEVYRASRWYSDGVRHECAVKRLLVSSAECEMHMANFARESRIAALMNHRNVVTTYDTGDHEGTPYIEMEYLEGVTLRDEMRRAFVMDGHFANPISIVCEMLRGLHYVHELRDVDGDALGLVHGDVSPHNVFLTNDGRVVIIDFGASFRVSEQPARQMFVVGKPGYMAPEYVDGLDSDRRMDVFGAGVILWELLAGRCAPRSQYADGKPTVRRLPRLSTVLRDIDTQLECVVTRATAPSQDGRFPTAESMRLALDAATDGIADDRSSGGAR